MRTQQPTWHKNAHAVKRKILAGVTAPLLKILTVINFILRHYTTSVDICKVLFEKIFIFLLAE